ncbi:hypothetical protein F4808DRAFT_461461 [Astrocystis sublimbata]|nr:hypothetical protein F4808DRAFT_461461 [Astrocystis sublimbata]
MTRILNSVAAGVLAIASCASAQCGAGTPYATVVGSDKLYTASNETTTFYAGEDYRAAIQAALVSTPAGERTVVMASGSIGAETITIPSGKIFEGCGTIHATSRPYHAAVESVNSVGTKIPYLHLTGSPSMGMRFFYAKDLELGEITMDLESGFGIRFDHDQARSSNVKMGTITVSGAEGHAVEAWNVDGLTIEKVNAHNVGECGLLLQNTTNVNIGLVEGC